MTPETEPAKQAFRLTLTDVEKCFLRDLVRLHIGQTLQGAQIRLSPLPLRQGRCTPNWGPL